MAGKGKIIDPRGGKFHQGREARGGVGKRRGQGELGGSF